MFKCTLRLSLLGCLVALPLAGHAKHESRLLNHYVPQELLEKAVRAEGWTEVPIQPRWGVKKGDFIRVWAGGFVDRGGDQPGTNVGGPEGTSAGSLRPEAFALSSDPQHAFAILIKTEDAKIYKCGPAGKPVEVPITKDNDKIFVGFNDEKG